MAKKITKKKQTKKVGRPTDYAPEYAEQVFRLCLLGLIDREIAAFFEIAESTLNNWKLEHPEFLESIKKGKVQADANVAASLYKQAIKGNTVAQIFVLKNRHPDKWREKHTQVIENPDGTSVFSGFNFLPFTPVDEK
ncbi:MAG: hypothetical protein LBF04_04105 [Prevotellaceae bacterium]|jgi:hypothetical protein|nr:hypothetical protein [Prevotellaceae bacterium]